MELGERWAKVVAEVDPRLDEGALVIAAHIQPGIDVDRELARLDDLAARCRPGELGSVRKLLFDDLALKGDTKTYDDPRNSSLPSVLDCGVGIPITLSVLFIEVARRADVELCGVGMPGHFVVRTPPVPGEPPELLDPFGGGRALTVAGARDIFVALQGDDHGWSEELLAPTPTPAILTRLLANLTASYTARDDLAGRRWVASLRAALVDGSPGQQLGVASELTATGAFGEAARLIDQAADGIDDPDADRLRARARGVRARLN